jgi:hypothetical protein
LRPAARLSIRCRGANARAARGGRASGRADASRARRAGRDGRGQVESGIVESLFVTEAAVQKHVTNIFHKLALGPTPTGPRRVPTFASHEPGRRSGADGGGCGASRLTAAASRRRACRRRRDSRD